VRTVASRRRQKIICFTAGGIESVSCKFSVYWDTIWWYLWNRVFRQIVVGKVACYCSIWLIKAARKFVIVQQHAIRSLRLPARARAERHSVGYSLFFSITHSW